MTKGLQNMDNNTSFNEKETLFKNIQARLIINHSSLEDVARELQTTAATIRTIIGNKFQRNGKSTPLDKKVFQYLEMNIQGFSQYCKDNNISML